MSSILGTEKFIIRSIEIHGNKYDYSKVNYKNVDDKVCIVCKEHGEFWQTPYTHMRGYGCIKCAYKNRHQLKSVSTFIEQAKKIHGDKYDYSKVNYLGNKVKVCIICKEHGEFWQTPSCHVLHRHGCKKCAILKNSSNRKCTTEEFINKSRLVHGNKYDYSTVNYTGSFDKISIICSVHGSFMQRPNDHLNGRGCPYCSDCGFSVQEKEMANFIKENSDYQVIENTYKVISPYQIDVYIPELKIAFEFNGLYWHNELNKPKDYHFNKTEMCERLGIQLIHIYEDDWINKKNIIKSRILNILGKSNIVYARKCKIKQTSYNETKFFLDKNHLKGMANSNINFGLFYENKMVAIMTFAKLKKLGEFELLRFCNVLNTNVVGGASKLLKHFISQFTPTKLISYADRSWTAENKVSIYKKIGFCKVGKTKPNYFYVMNGIKKSKFNFRKDVLIKEGFDKNKTEHEIMVGRGIYRIYDSGRLKFEYVF
jgi:hypothetical protein